MSRFLRRLGAGVLFACAWISHVTFAATGDLDRSYGQNGQVVLAGAGQTFSVTSWHPLQQGGFITVGNSLAANGMESSGYVIARFKADGTLDPSFDSDGLLMWSTLNPSLGVIDVKVQADGKLLVVAQAGTSNDEHIRLTRLNEDGSLDGGFASAGHLTLRYGSHAYNPRIAIAPDSSIVVLSRLNDWLTNPKVLLTKVDSRGAIDTRFGSGGTTIVDSPLGDIDAFQLQIHTDGSIFFAGETGSLGNAAPYIGHVTADGRRDVDFGQNGIAMLDFLEGDGYVSALAIGADGRAVAAGERHDATGNLRSFIARVTVQGVMDPTFGSRGRIVTAAQTTSLLVEPGGKVVTTAAASETRTGLGRLARYNVDGSPDPTFGLKGTSRIEFVDGAIPLSTYLTHLYRHVDGSYRALGRHGDPTAPLGTQRTRFSIVGLLASGTSAGTFGVWRIGESSGSTGVFSESSSSVPIYVYRTNGADGAASIQYRVVGTTATAGEDFVAASGTLIFQDGDAGTKLLSVQLIDDLLREPDEHMHVELFSPTGGAELSRWRTTITIGGGSGSGSDTGSRLEWVSPLVHVIEGAGTIRLQVKRTLDIRAPLTASYAVLPDTAAQGSDFVLAGGTISWAANEDGIRTIDVPIVDDAVAESGEQFRVALSVPSTSGTVVNANATVSIFDDDGTSGTAQLGFSVNSMTVDESASTLVVSVKRLGDVSTAVSATWSTASSQWDSPATPGADYTAASGVLSWNAGEASPKTVTIPLHDDTLIEAAETFYVNLTADYPASTMSDSNQIAVTMMDNDTVVTQPVVNLVVSPSVAEDAGTLPVTLSLSAAPSRPVSIVLGLAWQTATYADLIWNMNSTVSWGAGDATSKTVLIAIVNDSTDEIDETFQLALSSPAGGISVGTGTSVVTLIDDDITPPGQPAPIGPGFKFEPQTLTVREDDQVATLQLIRVGDSSMAMNALVGAVPVTAGSPGDFVSMSNGILQWNPGDTGPRTVEIQLNGDMSAEPTETMLVRVTAIASAINFQPAEATLTILDDDSPSAQPARVGFIQASQQVDEGARNVTLQVGRSGNIGVASTVDFVTAAGTATTADYSVVSGTLTWPENDASIKTIVVPITDDSAAESTEAFSVLLRLPSSGTELDAATASITVVDDDAPTPGSAPGTNPSPNPAPTPSQATASGGSGKGGGGGVDTAASLLLALLLLARRFFARQLRTG